MLIDQKSSLLRLIGIDQFYAGDLENYFSLPLMENVLEQNCAYNWFIFKA